MAIKTVNLKSDISISFIATLIYGPEIKPRVTLEKYEDVNNITLTVVELESLYDALPGIIKNLKQNKEASY